MQKVEHKENTHNISENMPFTLNKRMETLKIYYKIKYLH